MDEAHIAAAAVMVVAFVAVVRKHVPKVDGWVAFALVALASVGVAFLRATPKTVPVIIEAAVAILILAAGGNAFANKLAEKSAGTEPPPSESGGK